MQRIKMSHVKKSYVLYVTLTNVANLPILLLEEEPEEYFVNADDKKSHWCLVAWQPFLILMHINSSLNEALSPSLWTHWVNTR